MDKSPQHGRFQIAFTGKQLSLLASASLSDKMLQWATESENETSHPGLAATNPPRRKTWNESASLGDSVIMSYGDTHSMSKLSLLLHMLV